MAVDQETKKQWGKALNQIQYDRFVEFTQKTSYTFLLGNDLKVVLLF